MRFHFWASIKPIFENHVLSAVSGPFHPLYETKISNRWLSVVYGSITLKFFSWALGTISHQWFNRGNKIQKKVFLGHPIDQCFFRYFDEISQDTGKYCFGVDDTLKVLLIDETQLLCANIVIIRINLHLDFKKGFGNGGG